ncbi:MAG: DUF2505 family protein [Polyangiaceae bacterium]|nr:DUF2505 family protein [Polyangiaceae bacterium]
MHFEFVHDFDIARDAVELAVLSPRLIEKIAPKLKHVEKVEQREHTLESGVLRRVWWYQANIKIPDFARAYVTKEMCAWEERNHYHLDAHSSEWTIVPNIKPEWQKLVHASGVYRLEPRERGKCRRTVSGELRLDVPKLFARVAERLIVAEARKIFEIEALVLEELATLS